jgi:fucose permease
MPAPAGSSAFKLSEAFSLLGRPTLLLLSLFLFLYVSCEVGVWNWLKTYLVSPAVNLDAKTASNVVGFGFAFGILVGRIIVSRILINVRAVTVTLVAAAAMAVTTFAMLHVINPVSVAVVVFLAGLAMAPMFPTALAMVGDAFPRGTASAMGIAITFGWIGLAVSSNIIGDLAGPTKENLGNALLILPAFSVVMVFVSLVLRSFLNRGAATAKA